MVAILSTFPLFIFFADGQIFDFPKLFQYGILPQPPRELLYNYLSVLVSRGY